MNHRKLRIAVIGAGHLGTIHTRLVKTIDEVELVGVADPSPAARQRIAEDLEVAVFEDHRPLIGKIDAAILAAPTDHHYWIGMELAEAGVHLLVEKPLTLTVAEADALIRAARARHLVLQVGHVERFNPAFTTAAAQLHRPRYIEAVRASGYTGRSIDVGVVLDLMIHDIDLVLSLVPAKSSASKRWGPPCWAPRGPGTRPLAFRQRLHRQSERLARQLRNATPHAGVRRKRLCQHRFRRGHHQDRPSQSAGTPRRNRFSAPLARRETTGPRELLHGHHADGSSAGRTRNAILDEQHDFVISIRTGQTPQVTGRKADRRWRSPSRSWRKSPCRRCPARTNSSLSGPHWNLAGQETPRRRAG
jgi:hypothetical protein